MSVMTRLYENHAAAKFAVTKLDALAIPGVDASILGGESLKSEYGDVAYRDPATGAVIEQEASGTATGAGVGAAIGGGAGLLAGVGMLAIPGIGPLVAAGWLAATAVGAASGALAGAAVGAVVDLGIPDEDVPVYSESFRRGGVAVSVRFPEDARMAVESTLASVPAASLPDLRRQYEADGWRHDETDAEREARLRSSNPVTPPPPRML